MADKENSRVKGNPGRPNCHVIKLKITHLQANREKVDSRPCIPLGRERNILFGSNCLICSSRKKRSTEPKEEFSVGFPKTLGSVPSVTGVAEWKTIKPNENPS
jgi:hypothetical protein